MSVSNLLAPNTLDVHCETLTVHSGVEENALEFRNKSDVSLGYFVRGNFAGTVDGGLEFHGTDANGNQAGEPSVVVYGPGSSFSANTGGAPGLAVTSLIPNRIVATSSDIGSSTWPFTTAYAKGLVLQTAVENAAITFRDAANDGSVGYFITPNFDIDGGTGQVVDGGLEVHGSDSTGVKDPVPACIFFGTESAFSPTSDNIPGMMTGHLVPNGSLNGQTNIGGSTANQRYANIYLLNAPNTSSDIRLKEQIKDLTAGTDFLERLRPVSYKMKGRENARDHWGLIAQEIRDVLREGDPDLNKSAIVVGREEDEEHLALRYTELIPALIKSCQELSARVRVLEAKTGGSAPSVAEQVNTIEQKGTTWVR